MAGPLEEKMRQKIEAEFAPLHYELVNESHMHNVPQPSETHFKLLVVSDKFTQQSRIERSRFIHQVLDFALKSGVHALSSRALTPQEWQDQGGNVTLQSPPCHGGSRK